MSLLITSRTGVSGPLPWATARIAMSRSVIMPIRRSFSPTGMEPASISAIIFATSRMLWPGVATRTWRVIASLTRIKASCGLSRSWTEQEIDRHGDREHRHGNAAADRDCRHRYRKHRLLRRRRLGRRDEQREGGRDHDPAADVRNEYPAHRTVI